jgi:hypothetical protein
VNDDYEEITTDIIPQVTLVRFYSETWTELQQKHPEFASTEQRRDIKNAIMSPTAVYDSRTAPGMSFVFVDHKSTHLGNALVVPVRIVESTSARVQTAYYRGSPYAEVPLWPVKDG